MTVDLIKQDRKIARLLRQLEEETHDMVPYRHFSAVKRQVEMGFNLIEKMREFVPDGELRTEANQFLNYVDASRDGNVPRPVKPIEEHHQWILDKFEERQER